MQKINVCDQDSAFGKSKYEELPPSEPKIYCSSCIESKAAAVQHSKGKEFKQPMLSSREPRIGETGISCANRVSVVIGDPTNDCSADVMEKQIILDSKVKLDKELQHKAVLKKRSLETSDQDGDDVENSERENVTIYAVDSISVERVQSRIAEENQCKTFSDKVSSCFTCQNVCIWVSNYNVTYLRSKILSCYVNVLCTLVARLLFCEQKPIRCSCKLSKFLNKQNRL